MCGIAGLILNNKSKLESNIRGMLPFLKERGPDNSSFKLFDNAALAHTRLSILDLNEAAHQPMHRNHTWIVYNGEIYNFKSLRKNLQKRNVEFETNSDTEVLIEYYNVFGIEKTLFDIKGMFAFAIFDQKKQVMHLCRDAFGKKPLYLAQNKKNIIFSSSIQAVKKVFGACTVNFNAVNYYLSELAMPQPQTIYKEICQVKPGWCYSYSLESNVWSKKNFHEFVSKKFDLTNASESDILELTMNKLTEAVNIRLESDVPIGAFLSGGVDSGLIVSLLAEKSQKKIKTFTVGFNNAKTDERELAQIVANRYQTEHHEIVADDFNIQTLLPDLIDYIGEPFADPSIVPSYLVCKAISEQVTVAISGDGGDELFGGYNDYVANYNAFEFKKKSKVNRNMLILKDLLFRSVKAKGNQAKLHQDLIDRQAYLRFYRNMAFAPTSVSEIFSQEVNHSFNEVIKNKARFNPKHSAIENLEIGSLSTRLLDDYLVKIDRMSMMNSLEVRSPFLDEELADFAFSIPSSIKYAGPKYILKKLVEKRYDKEIFSRKKKGFAPPIADWLRNQLQEMIIDSLNSKSFQSFFQFDSQIINQLLTSHLSKKEDNAYKLWALLVLQLWYHKERCT